MSCNPGIACLQQQPPDSSEHAVSSMRLQGSALQLQQGLRSRTLSSLSTCLRSGVVTLLRMQTQHLCSKYLCISAGPCLLNLSSGEFTQSIAQNSDRRLDCTATSTESVDPSRVSEGTLLTRLPSAILPSCGNLIRHEQRHQCCRHVQLKPNEI